MDKYQLTIFIIDFIEKFWFANWIAYAYDMRFWGENVSSIDFAWMPFIEWLTEIQFICLRLTKKKRHEIRNCLWKRFGGCADPIIS